MNSLLIACTAAAALVGPVNEPSLDDTLGSIAGQITFEGEKLPEAKPNLVVSEKESTGCHDHGEIDLQDRSLLIDPKSKAVANVVVMLEAEGVKPVIPKDPIEMDQRGCRYEPHVLLVPKGATIRFLNSDTTNHNVHSFPRKNEAVNKNVAGGSNFDLLMSQVESFEVKCDIHPWMKSYVVVTDATHFALTGADGKYDLTGVPAGTYTMSWWHETLGKGKQEITVEAGKAADGNFKVKASKKKKGGRRRR